MDWQFKVGFGAAILFGLLPFVVKDMPHWVTWPGLAVGGLFILWGTLPQHDGYPVAPTILFIAFCAGAAGCAAWGYDLLPNAKAVAADISISAGCKFGFVPSDMQQDIHFVEVNDLVAESQTDGTGLGLLQKGRFPLGTMGFECTVTNDSSSPVFNVRVPMKVTFIEALPVEGQPNSTKEGRLIADRQWNVLIDRLGAGGQTFTYYFLNGSHHLVRVFLPKEVELQRNQETLTVSLIQPPPAPYVPVLVPRMPE